MDFKLLVLTSCLVACASAWTLSIYPAPRAPPRGPMRIARFIHPPPPPQINRPIRVQEPVEDASTEELPRRKRNHDDYPPHTRGVAGPVHTFVKTDKNANYKWGVRHHVGNKYASEN